MDLFGLGDGAVIVTMFAVIVMSASLSNKIESLTGQPRNNEGRTK